jgi:hypothetical protein
VRLAFCELEGRLTSCKPLGAMLPAGRGVESGLIGFHELLILGQPHGHADPAAKESGADV